MTLLTLVLIIGLLLIVGAGFKRKWEARQQAAAMAQEPPAEPMNGEGGAVPFTSALRNRIANVQANLFGPKQPSAVLQFRAWLASPLSAEPELRHWLAALSDEQLNALAAHLERFAREMGFELNWLLNAEVAQQPVLAQTLGDVVLNYCRACYRSVTVQDELEVYKALRQYQQNPNSPHNRAFGQALFGKLLEQGLTSINVADHLALPEPQRREQIVAAINQVAAEKYTVLQRLVKELVVQHNGAERVAPAATTVAMNGAASKVKS